MGQSADTPHPGSRDDSPDQGLLNEHLGSAEFLRPPHSRWRNFVERWNLRWLEQCRMTLLVVYLTLVKMWKELHWAATSDSVEAREIRCAKQLDFKSLANKMPDLVEICRQMREGGLSPRRVAPHCEIPGVGDLLLKAAAESKTD